METVEPHPHGFSQSDWPFADPTNAAVISTVRVFRDDYPILCVSHADDGDWQILCGTTNEPGHLFVVCLGCCYQRDKTIGEMSDLPLGWTAWRDYVGGPWHRERAAAENDD